MTEKINETTLQKMFPHIAGYKEIREEAAQIVDLFQNEKLYLEKGAHYPKGWLFYGKPGTGKSRLAMDIAEYLDIPLIEISASDAIERKISIEEDIYHGFKKAYENDRAILFIDEIEKIAGYRKYAYEITGNLKNQKILLHELDKISSKEGVIVIATCNERRYLGEALSRSGRFDRQVAFPLPNNLERKLIINHFLEKTNLPLGVGVDEIVKMTGGFSGADIECVINEAIIQAVSKREESLSIQDFTYAIRRVAFRDLPRESACSKEEQKLTAYHETGHAYMIYRLIPEKLGSVSLLQQGESSGSTETMSNGEESFTLKSGEETCMIALAGFLSVKVMTGKCFGGNDGDFEKARKTISIMLSEGFYGFDYIVLENPEYSGPFSMEMMNKRQTKASEILEGLAKRTAEILVEGKEGIERLTTALLEKTSLSSREIQNIFENKK